MVPELTRRRLLAAGGLTATALTGGYAFAARTTEAPNSPSGWPMAQRDPAGRCFAPAATPPEDDVSVAWKRPFDARLGLGYRVTPVVADGRVYALSDELLVCDAASGEVQYRADRSATATPAVAAARAYESPTLAVNDATGPAGLHAGGGVELFGAQRGLTRWHGVATDDGTTILGTSTEPVPVVAADGTVLSSGGDSLTAIDSGDGTVRWQREAASTRPAVRNGIVYTTRYVGGTVVGFDLTSGEQRREIPLPDRIPWSVTATPEGLVVGTREGLLGLTADGEVRWRYEPPDATDARGAIAVGEGVAYTGLEIEGLDVLVAVDTADGTERWRSDVDPASLSGAAPPAVAANRVYIPTQSGALVAVDAETGEVSWRFQDDGEQPVPMSPAALVGEYLYVIGSNHVYALEDA